MHSGLPGLGLSLGKIQPLEGTVRTNPAAGRNIHLCVCACVSECVGLCVCVSVLVRLAACSLPAWIVVRAALMGLCCTSCCHDMSRGGSYEGMTLQTRFWNSEVLQKSSETIPLVSEYGLYWNLGPNPSLEQLPHTLQARQDTGTAIQNGTGKAVTGSLTPKPLRTLQGPGKLYFEAPKPSSKVSPTH